MSQKIYRKGLAMETKKINEKVSELRNFAHKVTPPKTITSSMPYLQGKKQIPFLKRLGRKMKLYHVKKKVSKSQLSYYILGGLGAVLLGRYTYQYLKKNPDKTKQVMKKFDQFKSEILSKISSSPFIESNKHVTSLEESARSSENSDESFTNKEIIRNLEG